MCSSDLVQQPHCPLGEQPSLGEVTFNSSRRAARRCGCVVRTVTGTPLTTKPTPCPVTPIVMGLPYRIRKWVLQFVKGAPVVGMHSTLVGDPGVDLWAPVTVEIEEGVFVLVTPIEVTVCPDKFVA